MNESDQGDCFEVEGRVNLRAALRRKSDGKGWTCHMILLLTSLKAEGFHGRNGCLKKDKPKSMAPTVFRESCLNKILPKDLTLRYP